MYNYIHYHYYIYIYIYYIHRYSQMMSRYPLIFGAQGSCKESDSASSPAWTLEFGWFITQYCHVKKQLKKHQAKNGVYVCILYIIYIYNIIYIYIWKSTIYIYLCLFLINGEKDVLKIMEYFQSKIAKHQISMPGNLGWCPSFPTNPPSHHSACGEAGASAVSCIIEKPHCGWESMGVS